MLILHYDTETTGLMRHSPLENPANPDIVQIGAILDDAEGKELARIDLVIYCEREIPDEAAKVHGITTARSRLIGVGAHAAMDTFLDMVSAAGMIVGFNHEGYDNKVVNGFARRLFNDPEIDAFAGKESFDCMKLSRSLVRKPSRQGGYANPKLIELYRHLFGEDFEDAHTAIADVLATRRCFWRMQEIIRQAA